jgi:PAS domain S-box-containing protein
MEASLFEEVPCYLTVVDRNYRIVRANKAFRDQFGDHVGKQCFAGYKGLDTNCADCPVRETFSDGMVHQSEETWMIDGKQAHLIVKTAPIFDEKGNVHEVLEMSMDVTELKRLQVEVEKSRKEYKHLFENVPCYLTVVDRDYNVVQANKLFKDSFGANPDRKCFNVYKKRDVKCDDCPVQQTFDDGESHTSEHLWIKDGRRMHIVVHTAPVLGENGEIKGVMEMCTDITEVKRLQSELALLGETIAGMSHTVKNILSGLQGGVYIVDSGLERKKEDRIRQGWAMVKKNVEKVSDMVHGILYASKAREPDYEECDPGEILSEVCDLFEAKAQSEGIELTREFESEMGKGLLDPAGLHTVLSNLLSNAVEAFKNDTSESPRIGVASRIENGALNIRVYDNGIGIPTEVKERLFGKFYSTKGSRGTGLGLVVSRKVIEEHGGRITVESQPGQGTSFDMEIPFRSANARNRITPSI